MLLPMVMAEVHKLQLSSGTRGSSGKQVLIPTCRTIFKEAVNGHGTDFSKSVNNLQEI
jgi:hypothetical protein